MWKIKICLSLCVDFSGQGDLQVLEVKSNTQAPCEATNREAFFSRVESYSISFYSFWPSMIHQGFLSITQLCDHWWRVTMNVTILFFLCLSEIFLSMALFEMGRQTAHTIPSYVRQIWLDQCWLWYAQVLQLPGVPMCIATTNSRLWKMWAKHWSNRKDNVTLYFSKVRRMLSVCQQLKVKQLSLCV